MGTETASNGVSEGGVAAAAATLSVTDNRTGQQYEIPISDGTIRSIDLRQIRTDDDDFGLMTYDPAFMNTGVVPFRRSRSSTATRGSSSTAATRSSSSRSSRPTSRSPTC